MASSRAQAGTDFGGSFAMRPKVKPNADSDEWEDTSSVGESDDDTRSSAGDIDDPKSFRDGRSPRATDIFIAVMGVTGSGKSSFISLCCGNSAVVGHDLTSCTQRVNVYPFDISPSQTVYLLDTPGFDDTTRGDTEVLRSIVSWLNDMYKTQILLRGVIYFHRIIDPRMQGSAKKNVLLLQKLCGEEALKNTVLVTSMWDKVTESEGEARETQLINTQEFWGFMIDQGSTALRHDNSADSARTIIKHFIDGGGEALVLKVQEEMVNKKQNLEDTSAALQLNEEFAKERRRWKREKEEMFQVIRELGLKGEEYEKASRQSIEDYRREIEKLSEDIKRLKASPEELHSDRLLQAQQHQQAMQAYQALQAQQAYNQATEEMLRRQSMQPQPSQPYNEPPRQHQPRPRRRRAPPTLPTPSPPPAPEPEPPYKTTLNFTGTSNNPYNPFISFYGDDRCAFFGPQQVRLSEALDRLGMKDISAASTRGELQYRFVTCGNKDTWVASTLSIDGKQLSTHWSGNLPKYYPALHRLLIERANQPLMFVSLGPKKTYYARFENSFDYLLPTGMKEVVDSLPSGWQGIRSCALGANGTYVLITEKDGWRWNLKGYYGDLAARLKALDRRPRGVALDVAGTEHFVLQGSRLEDVWYSLSQKFSAKVVVSSLIDALKGV